MLLIIVSCSGISTSITDQYCISNNYLRNKTGDRIGIVVTPLRKDEESIIKLEYCGPSVKPSRNLENLILDVDNKKMSIEFRSIERKNISEEYFLTPTTFSRDDKLKNLNVSINYVITYDQIDSVVKSKIVKVDRFGGLKDLSLLLDQDTKDQFNEALDTHNFARILNELKIEIIDLTETFKIVFDKEEGVYINDVSHRGLGELMGLEPNTIILNVNNTNITSVEQLKSVLLKDIQLEALTITVRYTDGTEKTLTKSHSTWENDPLGVLGIKLKELNSNYKEVFDTDHGIFIDDINENGYGARQGLEVATVILQLDDTLINSVDQFVSLLKERVGQLVTITFKTRNEEKETKISLSN